MGGGLMQLVAYGAQDIYLTGNPQIAFFKVVYRRHTNFSMEAIEQTWNGSANSSGRCTATISRNGDLVHRMYLEVDGAPKEREVGEGEVENLTNPGVGWIKTVELEIGGQKIDQHSGVWMETWAELTETNSSSVAGLISLTGNKKSFNASGATLFQNTAGYGGVSTGVKSDNDLIKFKPNSNTDNEMIFTVPLQFWFCRNVGLALPLIALQYHEVKVILDHSIETYFKNVKQTLYADYIYLDTDERRRFAQVSHEYLIEQVQEQGLNREGTNTLNFNHPVKELIWTSTNAEAGEINSCSLHSPCTVGTQFTLQLNGHERFSKRESTYFSRTQVKEYHTGPGGLFSELNITTNSVDAAMVFGQLKDFSNSSDYEEDSVAVGGAGAEDYILDYSGVASRAGGEDYLPSDDVVGAEAKALLAGADAKYLSGQLFRGVALRNRFRYAQKGMTNDAICVYSFALKPEEHQPSGTCNFSRIDSAQLIGEIRPNKRGPDAFKKRELAYDLEAVLAAPGTAVPASFMDSAWTNGELDVMNDSKSKFLRYNNSADASLPDNDNNDFKPVIFAVNYNVLRIMSGMGGLAYSN